MQGAPDGQGRAASRIRQIALVAGAILFVYLFVRLGAGRVLSLLWRIGWGLLAVLLIYAVYQGFRGAALRLCLLSKQSLSYGEAFWVRVSGEAVRQLTFTGPFLAEPAKAWLLRGRRGITSREAFAGTLAEYLSYTFCSSALSVAALYYLINRFELSGPVRAGALVVLVAMAVFLAGAAIAIFFRIYLIGAVIGWVSRLPLVRSRLSVSVEEVNRMEDLLLELLRDRPPRFAAVMALELAAQAFLVLELYWILRSLELAFPPLYPLLIEGAIKFVSLAFFFVPTQIGASEAVYSGIFEVLGFSAVSGFTVSFLRRLRNLVTAAAGLGAAALLSRR